MMDILDFGGALDIIVKFGVLVLMLVYLVFSALLIKQIKLMTRTLTSQYAGILSLAGWIHLGLAFFVLVLAIIL